jgi:hypothetical protein
MQARVKWLCPFVTVLVIENGKRILDGAVTMKWLREITGFFVCKG